MIIVATVARRKFLIHVNVRNAQTGIVSLAPSGVHLVLEALTDINICRRCNEEGTFLEQCDNIWRCSSCQKKRKR